MWLDEAISVWFANESLGNIIIKQTSADVHPPFYYIVLSLWINVFGNGEFEVRLLSAIFGILSIPLLYLIVKDLFGNLPALISALMLALSPFHVYYSQEARMYSILTFFVLLSIFFMAKMLCIGEEIKLTKKTIFYSIGYVISTVAALYCHNVALLLPLAQNLFFIIFWNRHRPFFKFWTLSLLIIITLWAPWTSFFFEQSSSVGKSFYTPQLTLESIFNLFATFNNGPTYWLFNWIDVGNFSLIHGRLVLVTIIFFSLLFLAGIIYGRRNPRSLVLLLLISFVPIGTQLLISLKHSILATQTLIWASGPYIVLIALGISSIKRKWVFALTIVLISVLNSASLYKYYAEFKKERWDLAAEYVSQNSGKEDLVLFSSALGQIPFEYYFDRYNLMLEKHGLPTNFSERKMTIEDVPALEDLIQNHKRVWLIYSHEWFTDPEKLSESTLKKNYCLSKSKDFKSGQSNLSCYLFERCK
ncbi:MAG TPA: glycosyltransferase family 39 protein [Thermodesulfobacteriota bacterium]|nr:glycosyltransferase family 39 protein [Thermodesulfobacteriota bacterium]